MRAVRSGTRGYPRSGWARDLASWAILAILLLVAPAGCATSRLRAGPDGRCELELVSLARAGSAKAVCGGVVLEVQHDPISPGLASVLSAFAGYLAGWIVLP